VALERVNRVRARAAPGILIVDQDPWVVALARLALAKEGMEVTAASSASEALAALDGQPHQRIHCIVLDVTLPDLSGWELLRRIRERSDVPVMVLTRRDSDIDKARGLDLGADDYLTKPFSFLELEARVRALLRRARRASRRRHPESNGHIPERRGRLAPSPDMRALAKLSHLSGTRSEDDGRPVIALIVESRHLQDAAIRDTRASLTAAGCKVELVVPGEDRLYDIPAERPAWDAAVSRGRDRGGLGLLAAAEALGVRAINRPAAIDLVRNKVAMQAVLRDHGIPVPRTWFAATANVFKSIPSESFPLVVKPFDGDGSLGVALLTRPEDVDALPQLVTDGRRALYLAQEFLETDGSELKLYGIGSRVWAVRKPSPVTFRGPGPAEIVRTDEAELVGLDATLRDIALTCGRACGLELWGVDVAMTRNGPRVIEVNDFPTYSAVPDAGAAIARYVQTLIHMDRVARLAGRDRIHASVRAS
jgi:glutathione synthase/RimK-type ligase-like ATP-grasp enzyme/CheY-like chemotaxis protein